MELPRLAPFSFFSPIILLTFAKFGTLSKHGFVNVVMCNFRNSVFQDFDQLKFVLSQQPDTLLDIPVKRTWCATQLR